MGQEQIVRYWQTVELLQPQSAPKWKKRSSLYAAFIYDTSIDKPTLPWSTESVTTHQRLPKGRVWSHALFAHLYDSRLVAEQLKRTYGADQGYREPQLRKSALFAARFTKDGQFVDDSFVLSSEAWFLGCVLTGKDWTTGFEDDQKVIDDRAKVLFDGQVSSEALRALTQWTLQYIGITDFFGDMDNHDFQPTGWIQASGTSEGNWVDAEGKALEKLLARLRKDGVATEDISVITPFKDVEENLKRLLCDEMVLGTIHTMQGKEASIVILVQGGNTAGSGARNWVVSEPNLLNVAATRAKRRLYVIGDRNEWENRSLFCEVMDLLPIQIQPHLPHEQILLIH